MFSIVGCAKCKFTGDAKGTRYQCQLVKDTHYKINVSHYISGHTAVQPFIHTGIKLVPECHTNMKGFLAVRLKVHQKGNYSE